MNNENHNAASDSFAAGVALAPGETLVGTLSDEMLRPYHLILLPGDAEPASHDVQMDWAKGIGGDLPNRIEQAMLLARLFDQFKECAYWSNETHRTNSGWAWCQVFGNGSQGGHGKGGELRARAVRRLFIHPFSNLEITQAAADDDSVWRDSLIERLSHHAKDKRNGAFARATMTEAVAILMHEKEGS